MSSLFRKPKPLIDISPAAFEAQADEVRKAIEREFGFQLRANQIETSRVLLTRSIAELATGEGKTIAAVIAISLLAQRCGGVLVSTSNDYLARRDSAWMQPIYESLGLCCGVIVSGMSTDDRRAAYACDITYGTIREFGFDFLRDCLAQREDDGELMQREPDALIVDEADSLLIDEARTPLLISGPSGRSLPDAQACYRWCADSAKQFQFGQDYVHVGDGNAVAFTAKGRAKVYGLQMPAEMDSLSITDILHALERAIYVSHAFVRNQHYIVDDGKIAIVDEFTGRVSEGRTWSGGLHQAVEAREGVTLTQEVKSVAQVTVQDFVRRFPKISGMTGTAQEAAQEFRQVYNLEVTYIESTHGRRRLEGLPSVVVNKQDDKWSAIADDTAKMLAAGRAVLIGTRTIEQTRDLSRVLSDAGIDHEVLNATNPEKEAEIIALAGQAGRVTVATNMAGRGTDIALEDSVRAAGGMHVIGSELHASGRIDRQLAGRAARFGDPGSYRQFLALDDEIFDIAYSPEKANSIRKKVECKGADSHRDWAFYKAQAVIELRHRKDRAALAIKSEHVNGLYESLGLNPILDRFISSGQT